MAGVPKSLRYVKPLVYLLVIVLINLAGLTLFFRIDLTEDGIYSISDASQKVVATLTEPLTINVFFTQNLPAPHNNTERYLRDLLEEYAIYANDYFNYRFYDVNPETEGINQDAKQNQELADNYGIHPVQIQAIEKDEVKFKKAYMGLVMIHGDMVERVPTITSIQGLEYKLTTAIQKLNNKVSALLRLKDKIDVELVLSEALEKVGPMVGIEELQGYAAEVERIVGEMNPKYYGKLSFRRVDPSENPDADIERSLMTLSWPALPQKNITAGKGSIGMRVSYGGQSREVPLLQVFRLPLIGTQYNVTPISELEEKISANIETLIDINERVGYLADHGTLDLNAMMPTGERSDDALTHFSDLLSETYSIKPFELKDGTLPEEAASIIVARPTEKFTDYELFQIDQALMRGKNLALFLDAFQEIQPQGQQFSRGPAYVPLNTGLERLLEHYGVRLQKSIVLDENCHKQRLPMNMGGGERPFYFAPIIKSENINPDLDYLKNIKGLITVKASPLEIDEKRLDENGIAAHTLFSSSERSWEMKQRINLNPLFITPPKSDSEMRSYPLAYLLEGEFRSYFEGKPIPEKETGENGASDADAPVEKAPVDENGSDMTRIEQTGGMITRGRPAKIFIIAASEMLKNNILDADGESPNAMFIMNMIDALNDRTDIAVMRSKVQEFNPLQETSAFAKTAIKSFNIVGLPILVVLCGLLVWLRRLARKKRIQMMFQTA